MLTIKQRATIREYTDQGYQEMNRQLREGEISSPIWQKIEDLKNVLDQLPDFRGDVYRGATLRDFSILEKYCDVRNNVVEEAFVSTSKSPLKAFSGNVRFYIASRHGKDIARWSKHPDEEEVLFAPGSRFKVLAFESSGAEIEIFLEEM